MPKGSNQPSASSRFQGYGQVPVRALAKAQ